MQPMQLGTRVLGAHRRGDPVTFTTQKARQQIADAAVVIHQQQMRRIVSRLGRGSRDSCSLDHARSFVPGLPVLRMVASTLSGSS